MEKNKNKKLSANLVALVGAILIVGSLFLIFYNFINKKRLVAYDYINEQLNTNVDVKNVSSIDEGAKEDEKESEEDTDLEHYIGYLEIPKIGFNRGF